jgi:hypothetical protein
VELFVVEPLPSWPLAFWPQQYAAPLVVRAHVKSRPALSAANTRPTAITADPLCPSLVAVIIVEPVAAPLTSPVADTDAIVGAALAQLSARPGRRLPVASLGVAVNWTVPPTRTLAYAGVTATEATGQDPMPGPVAAE